MIERERTKLQVSATCNSCVFIKIVFIKNVRFQKLIYGFIMKEGRGRGSIGVVAG